jgi:hypothetical protein
VVHNRLNWDHHYPYEVIIEVSLNGLNPFFLWVPKGGYTKLVLTKDLDRWLDEMITGVYHFDNVYSFHLDADGNPYTKSNFVITFEHKRDAMLFKLAWA